MGRLRDREKPGATPLWALQPVDCEEEQQKAKRVHCEDNIRADKVQKHTADCRTDNSGDVQLQTTERCG